MSTVFPKERDDLTDGFVAFPADRAAAYREAGYWTGSPLDSILGNAADRWPDARAIVDSRRSYTFAELDAIADELLDTYDAEHLATLVREAAEVYERRDILAESE